MISADDNNNALHQHLSVFNEKERKVLCKLHKKILLTGGPINRTRFQQLYRILSNNNNEEPTNPVTVEVLFKCCDQDNDGLINAAEWLNLLALVFRVDEDYIMEIFNALVKLEEKMLAAVEEAPPEPEIATNSTPKEIIKKSKSKSKSTTKVSSATPSKKKASSTSSHKQHTTNKSYEALVHHNHSRQVEAELKLLKQKKSAMVKMRQAISDKVLLYKLWDVVCTEPFLMNAWGTSAYPTGKLISCTKAVATIQSRGHFTGNPTPLYVSQNIQERKILKKHERLLHTYANMYASSNGRRRVLSPSPSAAMKY